MEGRAVQLQKEVICEIMSLSGKDKQELIAMLKERFPYVAGK
jgi:hypothetical protein